MTKSEFISSLKKELRRMKNSELKKTLSYYGEIIDDKIESGKSEEEAVAELDNPKDIAAGILEDDEVKANLKPEFMVASTLLLIIGSPVWVPIAIAVIAIIAALYITAWALIFSFAAAELSIALSAIACVLAGIIAIPNNWLSSLFLIGAALVLAGLAILLFFPLKALVKWAIHVSWSIFDKIRNSIVKRVGGKDE